MRSAPRAGSLPRAVAAGLLGTALMTAWQELSARLQGAGENGDPEREPAADPWEEAPAPAKVAKRIGEGVFNKRVSADLIPLLGNAMHWGYGIVWGAAYGLGAGRTGRAPGPGTGALFGTGIWLLSYAQLVPLGIYEPPWRYPAKDLMMDLSYHLVYGVGVASACRLLER